MNVRALLLALPFLSFACGSPEELDVEPDDADAIVADDGKADSASSTYTYYSVRPDYRRCVAPLCGGYWVKKLNSSTASEVYVAEMTFTRAGLDDYDRSLFSVAGSLVRGTVGQKTFGSFGKLSVFSASEVWAAGSPDATPTGTYYKLTDKNFVCAKAPCFNIASARINSSYRTTLSGLAGSFTAEAGTALRTDDEILVAGYNRTDRHAGWPRAGKVAEVSAWWTRVKHYAGPTCATVRCAAGTTCEMVQVYCIKAPCYPVPTCLVTDEHLVELAQAHAGTTNFYATEAEAYAAAQATTDGLSWLAYDGANNKFVSGRNDLWAERFEIDRVTGDVTVTAEH